MKMSKIEKSIIDFCIKYKDFLFILILTFIALQIRISFLDFISGDYVYFLEPWSDIYKNYGISGLKYAIGDYNCIYNTFLALFSYIPIKSLYIIKMFSLIFDFGCGILGYKIVKEITNNRTLSYITYSIILFIPTVLFNSSLWGQCDAVYTFFALFGIYFLIKEKYLLSFVFVGISFAFKLQVVFILPVYIIYYIVKKRYSILYFLIIPLVNIICSVPSLIMGRSFKEIIMIYFNQTTSYSNYVLNFPNMYQFIGQYDNLDKLGILITILMFGLILYYILKKKITLNNNSILFLSMISVVIATYFLPYMHDRYLFMGDIFSVIWYISNKNKKYLYVPISICLVSFSTYIKYLFDITIIDFRILSLLYLFVIIKIFYDIINNKRILLKN